MKLNVKENLKNLEMYFCDVLGFDSYMESNTPHNVFYNGKLDKEYLVLEIVSVRHLLENMNQDNVRFSIKDVLDGKIPMPNAVHAWFGDAEYARHWRPCIMVSAIISEDHEMYTDSGIKQVYYAKKIGFGSKRTQHALDYFLYCYDRKHRNFRDVPKSTIKKIEDYLRSHGREIYDCR